MIDYEKIVSRIQNRNACDRDEAWTAVAIAYLKLDAGRSEAEQAEYLYRTGNMRVLDMRLSDPREIPVSQLHARAEEEDEPDWRDNLFVSPSDTDENKYMMDLIRMVPEGYRIPLALVVHSLLNGRVRNRKRPLTVEMTRHYLKRARIPKATEMARQVHTFLMTMEVNNV